MSQLSGRVTVYVVDEDFGARTSLQCLLQSHGYRVSAFVSAESFLERFNPRELACLIAEVNLKGMSGLELQDELIDKRSLLPIAFLTQAPELSLAVMAMKKGAADYLLKSCSESWVLQAVKEMSLRAARDRSSRDEAARREALLSQLSPRESAVLDKIVAGQRNRQIADELGISIKLVERYRARIMEKSEIDTTAELLRLVLATSNHTQERLPQRGREMKLDYSSVPRGSMGAQISQNTAR